MSQSPVRYLVCALAVLVPLGISATAASAACAYSSSLPTVTVGPGEMQNVIPVSASSECADRADVTIAQSSPSWLSVTNSSLPFAGGSANIIYVVQANTTGQSRTATISVGGQAIITVTQGTAPCVSGFSPSPLTAPYTGSPSGGTPLTVQAPGSCQWSATSFWIFSIPNLFRGTGQTTFGVFIPSNEHSLEPRSGTMTFGGQTVTVIQDGAPCLYTLTPPTANTSVTGGSGTVGVTGTGPDCGASYTPTVSGTGLTMTSSSGGIPGSVQFAWSANPNTFDRTGEITVGSARVTLRQNGPPARLDITSQLLFAVVKNPTPLVSPPEEILLTINEQPGASWFADVTVPWLTVTPSSGTGPATLRLGIDPAVAATLANGVATGVLNIGVGFAPATSLRTLGVSLNVIPAGGTNAPRGAFDTPVANTTGLAGAIPVTGWAVDDVDIARVLIYRDAVGSEPPGEVFIGEAIRVKGARPDIAASFFAPQNRRAGWGYMLLSNVLPNGGNGTFAFSVYAEDVDGHSVRLGRKTVTIDNASATAPFGTIDEPAQGATVSGTIVNRGWVLTPAGKTIPFDGSAIKVYIDGTLVAPVSSYNLARPDVKAYFPGLANSDGPEARLSIDTATLADGVHTIAWGVIDDAGAAAGIGSRYFTVQNNAVAPAAASRTAASVTALPSLKTEVWVRDSVDDTAPAARVEIAGDRREVRVAQAQRLELLLNPMLQAGCGAYEGYLRQGDVAAPLPAGASLDGATGIFRWQPPAEYLGRYDFDFVHRDCSGRERRLRISVFIEGGR